MAQIIASTYELLEQIGSGGGGIVYLGRHVRLDKTVVLKADKRTLAAAPEVLRREVDALKNLSHTYIPQVYDFVAEGDTVYTVMDYIEGESLDKPLARGERFPQAQVIEWACQLLDALIYLHSRPPHGILHSDIKPANIMLTPQGDIRLIDFNIALALGEDGSVRVGYSRGYASPEHYGLDYTSTGARTFETQPDTDATELLAPTESASVGQVRQAGASSSRSTGVGKKTVLLDARSDIYSLSATLYHLFSGVRPAQDARNVMPIHMSGVSPAVSAIIQKAMAPDPDQRYQTAQEMLEAFKHLHDNDPRTIRHKRRVRIVAAVLAAAFLAGGICTFIGLRQMEQAQAEAAETARLAAEAARAAEAAEREAKQALAAVTASKDAYRKGDVQTAISSALEALSLDSPYAAQAQKSLTDALGIYDLSDGFKSHLLLELPSEPLKVALSPSGTRVGVMVSGKMLVFDTVSGSQLVELPASASALSDLAFAGEDLVLFAGERALTAYDLASGSVRWTGAAATGISVSGDESRVAAIYRDENQATVYDAVSGDILKVVSFTNQYQEVAANDVFVDTEDSLFALNESGALLAVSFADGTLTVFDLRVGGDDLVIFDGSDFTQFEGGFYEQYLAFAAKGNGLAAFAVIDTEEKRQTGGFSSERVSYHAQTDANGIYISSENLLVKLHPVTGEQSELAYTDSDITAFDVSNRYAVTATRDGACSFFGPDAALLERHKNGDRCDFVRIAGETAVTANLDSPVLLVQRLEQHPETQVFSYDADYDHHEARISADGGTVMLFRYDRFRLYDINGTVLAEVDIPDASQVYDQQYRRDEAGDRLEVLYNSGLIRTYSAKDGSLLSEEQGNAPDGTLYEEFTTSRLRIERPLHGTPVAYDKESGELVRELESDAYLTYVTEVDGYIVTEYMTAQGERYGLLLNEDLDTLAKLPNLCDITADGCLIFDDKRGNLRQSRIYSIQELIALAKD